MSGKTILLNTAYFPPVNYFSLIISADKVFIEREETYIKQTYRNRCSIYSANGPMILTVPVLLGSFHKTPLKEIKIDYSKRWQQIHLRALVSSYKSSPFFEFYFPSVESVVSRKHKFLLDLNLHSLDAAMKATCLKIPVKYTTKYAPVYDEYQDYRNKITPKKNVEDSQVNHKKYNQVFEDRYGFIPGLSIIDLIFNTGPDAGEYLVF